MYTRSVRPPPPVRKSSASLPFHPWTRWPSPASASIAGVVPPPANRIAQHLERVDHLAELLGRLLGRYPAVLVGVGVLGPRRERDVHGVLPLLGGGMGDYEAKHEGRWK